MIWLRYNISAMLPFQNKTNKQQNMASKHCSVCLSCCNMFKFASLGLLWDKSWNRKWCFVNTTQGLIEVNIYCLGTQPAAAVMSFKIYVIYISWGSRPDAQQTVSEPWPSYRSEAHLQISTEKGGLRRQGRGSLFFFFLPGRYSKA